MAIINYTKGNEGGGWVPLPEGTYDVKILEVKQGVSKSNNPQLSLKGEVMDGPSAGKTVTIWYSLTPQSTWKLDALLEALAIKRVETGEYHPDGQPIMGFDDDDLLHRVVRYDVKQREYQGKVNNDFSKERPSPYDDQPEARVPSDPSGLTQTQQQQASAPAAAAAPAAAQQPGTIARRPRPAGTPS